MSGCREGAVIDVASEDAVVSLQFKDDLSNCMVACAIKRKFPGESVSVGFHTATIGGKAYRFPGWVSTKIEEFLDGKSVEPFSFPLLPL